MPSNFESTLHTNAVSAKGRITYLSTCVKYLDLQVEIRQKPAACAHSEHITLGVLLGSFCFVGRCVTPTADNNTGECNT